jgi:hypothetical protein
MCAEIRKASTCKTEKEEGLHHHPETEVQIAKIIFVLGYKI